MAAVANEMDLSPMLQAIGELESVGEEIVIIRRDIIDIDKKRNKNREALSALLKNKNDEKVYVCVGNMFHKVTIETAKNVIRQDQEDLNKKMEELREELKLKVMELRKLEGRPDLKGYDLKPLSAKEMAALKDIVPNVVI